MSDKPPENHPEGPNEIERERVLAAEYSLGLLEGEELLAARGRAATDPDFAGRRDWWDDWFVPLSDNVGGVEPGAHVWSAIQDKVSSGQTAAGAGGATAAGADNVVMLDMQRQVDRWRWTAGLTSMAAAVALAMFAFTQTSGPQINAPVGPSIAVNEDAAPLMASIAIGDTSLRLGVTVLPASDQMLVSAAGLSADGVHDHELWLVPANGGALQSLGVVIPGEERRVTLPDAVSTNMGDGVKLLLTREPLGGKPDGENAGPVVAEGTLIQV